MTDETILTLSEVRNGTGFAPGTRFLVIPPERPTYPLADSPRRGERFTHAEATGEFRAPLAGEWYLSGAIVEAYRAPSDLSTPYHIARPVSDRKDH